MDEPREAAARALACPACGGPVVLRAPGTTVNVFCDHCGASLDALSEDLKLIQKAETLGGRPRIALGTRGTLRGVLWEAVGYVERYEFGGGRWDEYLLFNPYYGYRFLVDDRRSWSLGRLLDSPPNRIGALQYQVEDIPLKPFGFTYVARVRAVLGEFYWRLSTDDEASLSDFVGPGVMVSKEELEDEVTWTRLDILAPGEVERAFDIPRRRNRSAQPSPHEISPYASLLRPVWSWAAIAFALLVLLPVTAPRPTALAVMALDPLYDRPEHTFVQPGIALPYRGNRVVIEADAPSLDNGWVDMDVSLVDQRTQASFDGYLLPEFYEGRDSDGYWSEGQRKTHLVFSGVPAGRYDLVVDAEAHSWSPTASSSYGYTPSTTDWQGSNTYASTPEAPIAPTGPEVSATVSTGGASGVNWLLALLTILAPPLVLTGLEYQFERRRQGAFT